MQAQQNTQPNAAGPVQAQRQSFHNAGIHRSVQERTERTSKPWTLLSSAMGSPSVEKPDEQHLQ
ncbi:hypothetical protein, partial [Pelagibius litoralis]|uniref:hypothetical protein n=1 Tax=Pelagibius litoralis TaxID=374515 RepID=UPI0019825617